MSEVVSKFLTGRIGKHRHAGSLLILTFAALYALTVTQPSYAQQNTWKRIKQFDRSIDCGYFIDKDHGLIGSGDRWELGDLGYICAIFKTTDGGLSWTASKIPALIYGAVTSISMQDSLIGYASIFPSVDYSWDSTWGHSSLWMTTDGGSSWFDPFHLDHVITSVYAQKGLLLFTKWDMVEYSDTLVMPPDLLGGNYSFNDGQSWIGNFRRGNGIGFSDSLNGVVTEMNSNKPGGNFWVTTDAGRSWLRSVTNQYEAWSVYAVPQRHIYFCANESQWDIPHTSVNWSTDGGFSWQERARFPSMHFTGTIAGVGNTLYVQTDSGSLYFWPDANLYQHGLYRSDDLGVNWHYVGGPSNARDTRFVVTGCEGEVVYAFDGFGGVWKTEDGGDGTLGPSFTFNTDSLTFNPSLCGDTIAFDVVGASCIPVTVDSTFILFGKSLSSLSTNSGLPQYLSKDQHAQVRLLYSPTSPSDSISLVRVWGHSGTKLVKRDITIRLRTGVSTSMYLSRDSSHLEAGACGISIDTIFLRNLGCPGMMVDSVVLPKGEVLSSTSFPLAVPRNDSVPLYFVFEPDSAGNSVITARLYAHNIAGPYDTLITIRTKSIWVPLNFKVDSTSLHFTTKYCQPRTYNLNISTTSCDSVIIDSIVSSNNSFSISRLNTIPARENDSLRVVWQPDFSGLMSGSIHIFAHDRLRKLDTIIAVSGVNYSLPQAITVSRTTVSLSTKACQPISDSLWLSDQGCEKLYLDSVVLATGELVVNFDSAKNLLFSDDSLLLRFLYFPSDGRPKMKSVHLFMHTASRAIDTTISVGLSNSIPVRPLVLSADSFYLFTKYCQPVAMPLQISNLGCSDFALDSMVVEGDARHEFNITRASDSIRSQGEANATLSFTPDTSGTRSAKVKLYGHFGSTAIDTTLSLVGNNLSAPVPYVGSITSSPAGGIVQIPILLEPTTDTFSIRSYSFHLSFNTNLLTPMGLQFSGTGSQLALSSSWSLEAGGVSGHVVLGNVISEASSLSEPLVYVLAKVSLTTDTLTQVTLDTFVTDVTGQLPIRPLCSIPSQPFYVTLACGDPLLLQVLRSQSVSIDFISLAPNPINTDSWTIGYVLKKPLDALILHVYSSSGREVYHEAQLPSAAGAQQVQIPAPEAGGDYFIVLEAPGEVCARKGSVVR